MSKSKSTKKKSSTSSIVDLNSEFVNESLPQSSASSEISVSANTEKIYVSKVSSTKSEGSSNDSCACSSSMRDVSTDIGADYMNNSILEEILNEKKAALLQSPEIVKLLREQQLKIQNRN
ncbi:hypothetical protein CDAR_590111 [Caerostris darwini]|uniref:Regulatory factor X-associated protein RFXANK-binding domain-containing protein n=1 Tax=Caerostris darwini TaxID=1538125 RepID=A0AAV4NRJ8_9ARAC|nr:hypothetical protein CDAR_590111 [Caerostris darwini]